MSTGQLCPHVVVLSLFYFSQEGTIRGGGASLSQVWAGLQDAAGVVGSDTIRLPPSESARQG